jgi:hypothetical protein
MTQNGLGPKPWVVEIRNILSNYTAIVEKAAELDPQRKSLYTRRLFYTIFNVYIPILLEEVAQFKQQDGGLGQQEDIDERYPGST